MKLVHLPYSHIEGFSALSDEQRDEFIALHDELARSYKPRSGKLLTLNNITSIEVTKRYNYRVSFYNRADIVLKSEKKNQAKQPIQKEKKEKVVHVRLPLSTHQALKKIGEQENKGIWEVLDTACKQYIDQYHNK